VRNLSSVNRKSTCPISTVLVSIPVSFYNKLHVFCLANIECQEIINLVLANNAIRLRENKLSLNYFQSCPTDLSVNKSLCPY